MEQSDLNAARLFVEVVQRGSFSAAARHLGLPKSTLSRRVSELERRLGVRLLQRTTRTLSLTDLGTRYFERAQRAVRDLAEAEALVTESQSLPRGVLRLTAPPDLGAALLSHALPKFASAFPEVRVVLDLSGRLVDLVSEGFDVALRAGSLSDSSLIAKPLFSGTFAVYASPDYLDARGRPEQPEELSSHECLVFGGSPEAQWQLESDERSTRVAVRGRLAAREFDFLRRLAVEGAGVALLPDFLVAPDLHRGSLERVLPAFAHGKDLVCAVYPSREFLPAKTRAFVEFIQEEFAGWQRTCSRCSSSARAERRAAAVTKSISSDG